MSDPVTFTVHGVNGHQVPSLGTGLWINHLDSCAFIGEQLDQLKPNHIDMLVDLRQTGVLDRLNEALSLCSSRSLSVWLYVVAPDSQASPTLSSLAGHLADTPAHIAGMLLTPAAYLASYQPDSAWPASTSPAEMLALGREIWPKLRLGGGFPTYFTELNRCRLDPTTIDFLTHATSPVIHAADDISVMESLESLPHVFHSAQALAPGVPYRVTTSAIGAWTNPYGGTLTPNPQSERVTLSDNDPRQRGLFAAAWNVGYMAQATRHVDDLTLSSLGRPFPITDHAHRYPLFDVLRGLNRGARQPALTGSAFGTASLAIVGWQTSEHSGELWIANTSSRTLRCHMDNAHTEAVGTLDETTLSTSTASGIWPLDTLKPQAGADLLLRPFAVARLLVNDIQPT